MFGIFGKKKEKEKSPPKTTISDLNQSGSRLIERSEDVKLRLEKIELELKTALEKYRNARTQPEKIKAKKKAIESLKKKKMYQAQLVNLEQVSNNLENVNMQVQIVRDNVDIMRTLKQSNDLQRQLMKEMNIETVDDMIEEMQETKILQEEFSDAIKNNYEIDVDETELDEELEQLDYEMKIELNRKELNVPENKILNKKEADEKDLENFIISK